MSRRLIITFAILIVGITLIATMAQDQDDWIRGLARTGGVIAGYWVWQIVRGRR